MTWADRFGGKCIVFHAKDGLQAEEEGRTLPSLSAGRDRETRLNALCVFGIVCLGYVPGRTI